MIGFELNGDAVEVNDGGASLLDVLREQLGIRSAKDGCSPQGQCGCCTVLVDGKPRVACVTPARRVQGRAVTTLEGMDADAVERWASAFTACGASQCGFCTPGIIVRLAALADPSPTHVQQALLAHLCRCTGWQTILEAAETGGFRGNRDRNPVPISSKSRDAAEERAAIEGGCAQLVGPEVAIGRGGFAEDTAPANALVAVPNATGEWIVAESLTEARRAASKVQGRRTTMSLQHPLEVPDGDWDVTLRTTWVEPGYLEPDASWCVPGGEPTSPVANGGAFGGKTSSVAPDTARRLADELGRTVRVVLSREDVVRFGPKRPPIAAGVRRDGSGVMRVARTPGVTDAVRAVAPAIAVEEVDIPGPRTSAALRAVGWAEATVLLAAATGDPIVRSPSGARASASLADDDSIQVRVACGDPLDEVVLRSYCIGAAHMALGWVTSEGIAVDAEGEIHDLTIRSFGILRAKDMPHVNVEIEEDEGPPINGSDAVFAAVAAAVWRAGGLSPTWPTERGRFT